MGGVHQPHRSSMPFRPHPNEPSASGLFSSLAPKPSAGRNRFLSAPNRTNFGTSAKRQKLRRMLRSLQALQAKAEPACTPLCHIASPAPGPNKGLRLNGGGGEM